MYKSHHSRRPLLITLVLILAGVLLNGCAPPVYTLRQTTAPAQTPTSVQLYFYPNRNQTLEQQKRDRYECYLWAVKQTGYDPNQAISPHQRVEIVPATPPGANVAAGAATGAIIGSILSTPRDRGPGLVFGAITGAMLGAATEQAQQEQAARLSEQYNMRDYAQAEKKARDYRRAMTACLEGRGYTVR